MIQSSHPTRLRPSQQLKQVLQPLQMPPPPPNYQWRNASGMVTGSVNIANLKSRRNIVPDSSRNSSKLSINNSVRYKQQSILINYQLPTLSQRRMSKEQQQDYQTLQVPTDSVPNQFIPKQSSKTIKAHHKQQQSHRTDERKQKLIEFLRGELPHIPFSQLFTKKRIQSQILGADGYEPYFVVKKYQELQL